MKYEVICCTIIPKCYGINSHFLLQIFKNFSNPTLSLLSGIIHGNGIGPILFVMYINKLAETLSKAGEAVRLFADGLKMYARMSSYVDVMQNASDRSVNWADL